MLPALLLLFSTAAPMVQVAPDQPLPFVYVDDPLVVEVQSDSDAEAELSITVQGAGGAAPASASLGGVRLHAGSPYWWSVKDLPAPRGHYQGKVRVSTPQGETDHDVQFCRIDRPDPSRALPVCALMEDMDAKTIVALRNAGIHTVRVDALPESFEQTLLQWTDAGFAVVGMLDVTNVQNAGTRAEAVSKAVLDHVVRWDIRAANTGQVAETADALRRGGSTAPIALVLAKPDMLGSLFENGSASQVRELVLESDSVSADMLDNLLHAARRTGVERWKFHAALSSAPSAQSLTPSVLRALGSGCSSVLLPASALYDGALNADFGRFSGMSKQLVLKDSMGQLPLVAGVSSYFFREHARWLLALWASEKPVPVAVRTGEASGLQLTDAFGNPVELPAPKGGVLAVDVQTEPVFLCGAGGDLLGLIAHHRFSRQARAFLASPEYEAVLPPELMQRVRGVAVGRQETMGRAGFLYLLRAFPVLEQAWHEGTLQKEIAAPALGELADLMRAWCTVQEESGEPFVTPMSDHMEKCEEYRALYLTGAEAGERGDWLLDEVLRLMNEADALAAAGCAIEGTALVAMAEWRARALDSAAKAPPLSEPVDEEHLSETPPEATTVIAAAPPQTPETPAAQQPATPQAAAPSQEQPVEERIEHTVARGENPSSIAGKYKVELDDLLGWNNLTRRSRLQVGDKLVVYPGGHAPAEPPAATAPAKSESDTEAKVQPQESKEEPAPPEQAPKGKKVVHTVRRGDNPSIIANKYGVPLEEFMRWNNLTKRTTLHIGQELVVYVPEKKR